MRNGKAIEEIRGDSKSKDLLSRLQARSHSITLNQLVHVRVYWIANWPAKSTSTAAQMPL